MKRRLLKVTACAAVMALTLSVTACGGSDDAGTTDTVEVEDTTETEDVSEPEVEEKVEAEPETEEAEPEVEEEAEVEEDTDTDSESDAETEFATLEDYYNFPGVKEQVDSLADSMQQPGVTMSIEISGNEFVLTAKYEDSSVVVDGISEVIDQLMETVEGTFINMAVQFDQVINQEGACTVIVRYMAPDDTVLWEKAYTANSN